MVDAHELPRLVRRCKSIRGAVRSAGDILSVSVSTLAKKNARWLVPGLKVGSGPAGDGCRSSQ
jgi:hypothetical protein